MTAIAALGIGLAGLAGRAARPIAGVHPAHGRGNPDRRLRRW